jgi:hypothetical protein
MVQPAPSTYLSMSKDISRPDPGSMWFTVAGVHDRSMRRTRRRPATSAWARSSRSRRLFLVMLLLIAAVGIGMSLTVHQTWWTLVGPACVLVGLLVMLTTPGPERGSRNP